MAQVMGAGIGQASMDWRTCFPRPDLSTVFDRFQYALVGLLSALALIAFSEFNQLCAQDRQPTAEVATEKLVELAEPKISLREFALRIVPLTRPELAELAKHWLKLTQQETMGITAVNVSLLSATGPERQKLEADLDKSLKRRRPLLQKLDRLLRDWEAKGAKAEEIAGYRLYRVAVARTELEATNPQTTWKIFNEWLISPDGGIKVAQLLLSLILSVLLAIGIAFVVGGVIDRYLKKTQRLSSLLRDFISKMAFWLILFVSMIIALSMNGINMTPLLAAFGGASFVIAFATQSTLSNLASGLLLMITQPFDIGDTVNVAGVSGRVQNVTIVSTNIRSDDGQIIVVPNTKIWDSVIVNLRDIKVNQ